MKLARTLLSFFLVLLTASLPLLAAPGGMITPLAGQVLLNGHPVVAGTAVLGGERIAITPRGRARLLLPGAQVLAAANTHFRILHGARALSLASGALRVQGSLGVRLRTRSIEPGAGAIFAVARRRRMVYVQAIRGSLRISGAAQPYLLPAGRTVRFDDAPAAGDPPSAAATVATHGARHIAIVVVAAAAGIFGGLVTHMQNKGAENACPANSCAQ